MSKQFLASGIIHGEVTSRTTAAGKMIAKFTFKTRDGLQKCIAWDGLGDTIAAIPAGVEFFINGFRNSNSFSLDESEVTVKNIRLQEANKQTLAEELYANEQSVNGMTPQQRWFATEAEQGNVPIFYDIPGQIGVVAVTFRKRIDCVWRHGRWRWLLEMSDEDVRNFNCKTEFNKRCEEIKSKASPAARSLITKFTL